jgi:hypothetical protein
MKLDLILRLILRLAGPDIVAGTVATEPDMEAGTEASRT